MPAKKSKSAASRSTASSSRRARSSGRCSSSRPSPKSCSTRTGRWLQPRFLDASDQLMLCIQSYLVQTPHPQPSWSIPASATTSRGRREAFWHMMKSDRYEKSLAATPDWASSDIDFVMCTHLHTDHVGWNTRLENGRWVPTLPEGALRFRRPRTSATGPSATEGRSAACPLGHRFRCSRSWPPTASIIVKSAHAFNDLVTLIPDARPHASTTYSVQVGRPGADAVITGDDDPLAAAGAISRARHDGGLRLCAGWKVAAGAVRPLRDTSTLICTAHFPSPSTARVVRLEGCVRLHRRVDRLGPFAHARGQLDQPQFQIGPIGVRVQQRPKLPPL